MKKIAAAILLAGLFTGIFAQVKSFTDSPFALGLGFSPAWLVPNFGKFNEKITSFGTDKLPTAGFFAPGYSGYVYVGFVPRLRVGGIRINGTTCQEKNISGYNHKVEFESGLSGLTIEYSLPWFRSFALSAGAIIGHGSSTLTVSRHFVKTYSWNDEWNTLSAPGAYTNSYTRVFNHQYFTLVPTLNADIPANRFIAFRIGAGYSIPFGSKWTMDNDIDIADMPSTTPSGGFFATAGIFIGFFAF